LEGVCAGSKADQDCVSCQEFPAQCLYRIVKSTRMFFSPRMQAVDSILAQRFGGSFFSSFAGETSCSIFLSPMREELD
jgi:hypothetical protein